MSGDTPNITSSIEQKPNFRNTRDELHFLHGEIDKKSVENGDREMKVGEVLEEYRKLPADKVLAKEARITKDQANKIALSLSPEEHDNVISDLLGIIQENGIYNTLNVVSRMNNPHIEDDLHRFLVQYLISGHELPGLVEKDKLSKALGMKLFSVSFGEDLTIDFRGLASYMEQFLAGMQSVEIEPNNPDKIYFSLELALSEDSDKPVFYISVPSSSSDIFKEQILGLYPGAEIKEIIDDYNIFSFSGAEAGSYGTAYTNAIFPIKIHDKLNNDSMTAIMEVFRRMRPLGDGAAIQILCAPVGDTYIRKYGHILESLKKGKNLKEILQPEESFTGGLLQEMKSFFVRKKEEELEEKIIDEESIFSISKKLDSTIIQTNIRLVVSAENQLRADNILREIEASFRQFNDIKGNSFKFERTSGNELKQLFRNFSFRIMDEKQNFPLNLKEIASIYHFTR